MRRVIFVLSALWMIQAQSAFCAITITDTAFRSGLASTSVSLYKDDADGGAFVGTWNLTSGGAIQVWTTGISTAGTTAADGLAPLSPAIGFCIEIPETIYVNGDDKPDYNLWDLAVTPINNGTTGIDAMGTTAASAIKRLWSAHFTEVTTGTFSSLNQSNLTAFQLAVWKLSYDGSVLGTSIDSAEWASGNLRSTVATTERNLATTWLDEALGSSYTPSDVWALAKAGSQDLGILVGDLGSPVVPEPMSLLVWCGLGLAVVVSARRRKAAAV